MHSHYQINQRECPGLDDAVQHVSHLTLTSCLSIQEAVSLRILALLPESFRSGSSAALIPLTVRQVYKVTSHEFDGESLMVNPACRFVTGAVRHRDVLNGAEHASKDGGLHFRSKI